MSLATHVLAGGCTCAFEAARQGKTAVVTVVSDQTGHLIRQASRSSRRGVLATVGGGVSFVRTVLMPNCPSIEFDKLH